MAKKKAKTATKDITFEKAIPEFLEHLKEDGKNERTVAVYGRCLENTTDYFGADKPLGKLTPATIGQYFKSDAFLKKPSGAPKAEPTIKQGRRVLRMMLVWAQEKGYITDIPLPKAEMTAKNGAKEGNGSDAGEKREDAAE
jgi:hypothetical protein